MTTIEIRTPIPNAFGILVEALWSGEISEDAFVSQSFELGVTVGRIEWEVEQVKIADGVA